MCRRASAGLAMSSTLTSGGALVAQASVRSPFYKAHYGGPISGKLKLVEVVRDAPPGQTASLPAWRRTPCARSL